MAGLQDDQLRGIQGRRDEVLRRRFEQAGNAGQLTLDWTPAASPTGIGKFSASYSPQASALEVTVRTYVEFSDHDQTWDPNEQIPWRDRAFQIIEDFWSDRYLFQCTRPGWDYRAVARVRAVPHPTLAGADLRLRVSKAAPAIGTQGGGVGWGDGVPMCGLDDLAAYPKDQVRLRRRIFALRKYQLEKKLSEMALGFVSFDKDSATLTPAQNQRLVDFAKYHHRISTEDVSGIQIVVWGSTGGTDKTFQTGLGRRRAQAVADQLGVMIRGADIVKPMTSSRTTAMKDAVKAIVAANGGGANSTKIQGACLFVYVPPSVVQEAEKNYIVLCHEYGHMLGLPDEYMGLLHPNLTARVNLDTLIPLTVDLATRAGNPDEWDDSATRKRGQQAGMADLAENQPNIRVPTYMSQNQVIGNLAVASSSIMYAGMEIWPAHYLTLWSALGQITREYLDPRHWTIIPSPRNRKGSRYFK